MAKNREMLFLLRRILSFVVDLVFALALAFLVLSGWVLVFNGLGVNFVILPTVSYIGFFVISLCMFRNTPGKRIFRLTVVTEKGKKRLSFSRAAAYAVVGSLPFVLLVFALILMWDTSWEDSGGAWAVLGLTKSIPHLFLLVVFLTCATAISASSLSIIFDKSGQGLHDKLLNVLVVGSGFIPNPYIAGPPLQSREMFFGRADDFLFIKGELGSTGRGIVLSLWGERRCGKSSILWQIQHGILGSDFLPFFIELQELGPMINSDEDFFRQMARSIAERLERGRIKFGDQHSTPNPIEAEPALAKYIARRTFDPAKRGPAAKAESDLLGLISDVNNSVEPKRILLLFDEIGVLEEKINSAQMTQESVEFLRKITLGEKSVSIILTGERIHQPLEPLLGRAVADRNISFLSPKDTEALIVEPVKTSVIYDEGVVDFIRDRLTSGQPFYTQLICRRLVDQLNEARKNFATREDLKAVIAYILKNPPGNLSYFWANLPQGEKEVLALIAELLENENDYVSLGAMNERIAHKKYPIVLDWVRSRLLLDDLADDKQSADSRQLLERHQQSPDEPPKYRYKVDLLRRWIKEEHSVPRTVRETSPR